MSTIENEYFVYDTGTGVLTNRVTRHFRVIAGEEAGCFRRDGYGQVRINGVRRLCHHVIWDMLHPEDPILEDEEIDHVDHNPRNNKPENLRKVKHAANCKNYPKMKSNRSGITGVYWGEYHDSWISKIDFNGKTKHLYQGPDFFEACCRRKSAEITLCFHENHGR
ncbi:TPA: HNH endonuclease [Salmonella enterica subsp. enterica serovar Infantis]|nr:HNH endonuclease [Salmonella enterica subsp. enterica serovar Infantis]HCI4149806.1 HNH endonuclease [Salmonella enterica subsp. enterica serovar Infantis]